MDKVGDLPSRKIENISRIGLPSSKRNHFLGGGAGGFSILTFLGRVPKRRPKNVSQEKNRFASLPSFLE